MKNDTNCPVCKSIGMIAIGQTRETTCPVCLDSGGRLYLNAYMRKALTPRLPIFRENVNIVRASARICVGCCSDEVMQTAEIAIKMRALGYNVSARNVFDWFDGGYTYNVFDRAACDALGIKPSDPYQNRSARLLKFLKVK